MLEKAILTLTLQPGGFECAQGSFLVSKSSYLFYYECLGMHVRERKEKKRKKSSGNAKAESASYRKCKYRPANPIEDFHHSTSARDVALLSEQDVAQR